MDITEVGVNKKLSDELKKYEILKKSFLKMYESEEGISKIRMENFEKIDKIEENDNKGLKDILRLFTSEMKTLERSRKDHIAKIMDLIIPVIDYYPEKIRSTKKVLDQLLSSRRTAGDMKKTQNVMVNVAEISENQEKNTGNSLTRALENFDSERIIDNKYLLLQYVHSELKYHSSAVEKISKLFFDLNKINPFLDMEAYAKKYNIGLNSSDLGVDLDKIKREEENRKQADNHQIDDVYKSVQIDQQNGNEKNGDEKKENGNDEIDDELGK